MCTFSELISARNCRTEPHQPAVGIPFIPFIPYFTICNHQSQELWLRKQKTDTFLFRTQTMTMFGARMDGKLCEDHFQI